MWDEEFVPRTSSFIRWVGYDPIGRVLAVDAGTDVLYRYVDVPLEVFRDMMRADIAREGSVGRYWNQHVRSKFDGPDDTKADN